MNTTTATTDVGGPMPSIGHLSVRVEGPDEAPFLFQHQRKRLGPAFVASSTTHAVIFLLAILAVRFNPAAGTVAVLPFQPNSNIIWLSQPGPGGGGGGGGGGNKMQAPPREAEEPGKDKITVPVTKPPKLEPPTQAAKEPDPLEQLNIPAKNLAAATESLPGAIDAPPVPTLSQGSGIGGDAGTGAGSGIGPGGGSGLGPGTGGGTGGGAYQPGNGVSMPRLLREVKPNCTSDAMRAKISGEVLLVCIVNTKGEVTDVEILRSLDATFGLDQEAIIELSFTLR